jgi:spore coat polysaccharide biosynthesis protein SpsF
MMLAGKPLLLHAVERIQRSLNAGTVVVATTLDPDDDKIVRLCEEQGIPCFRGDTYDLLDRHYKAAIEYGADAVVKIPSDCPLIDPAVIDRVIGFFKEQYPKYEFVSNLHPATYPDGNDVEIMTMQALESAWKEAVRPLEREHTTPYFWENPEKFRCGNILWETGLDYSMTHRWTIDYIEDYCFIKAVYEALYYKKPMFTLYDVLLLIESNPRIADINAHYNGVNWYRHHLHELRTIMPSQTAFNAS